MKHNGAIDKTRDGFTALVQRYQVSQFSLALVLYITPDFNRNLHVLTVTSLLMQHKDDNACTAYDDYSVTCLDRVQSQGCPTDVLLVVLAGWHLLSWPIVYTNSCLCI